MKKETVFQRYEFKYLLTRGQQAGCSPPPGARLRPDEYSHSSIRNLYLDTPDFRLIRRSLEKPVYKESCVCAAMAGGPGTPRFYGAEEKVPLHRL